MDTPTLPNGWHPAGSHPTQYEMGIDPSRPSEEGASAVLRSCVSSADGFGTLMQTCLGTDFLGKRIRFSALACCEDIEGRAGLWMRVDAQNSNRPLNFDNMSDRALTGSQDWAPYSVVLDVAEESCAVAFGVLLAGTGSIWISALKIEIVGLDVPSTNMDRDQSGYPQGPVNLDLTDVQPE